MKLEGNGDTKITLTMKNGRKIVILEMPVQIDMEHVNGNLPMIFPQMTVNVWNEFNWIGPPNGAGVIVSNKNPAAQGIGIYAGSSTGVESP